MRTLLAIRSARRMRPGTALLTLCLLLCLDAQAQQAEDSGYRIAGRVVNAETGAPLAGAAVAISVEPEGGVAPQPTRPMQGSRDGARGRRRPQQRLPVAVQLITTGNNGSFHFEHVPAGKYALEGSHRGFLNANYDQHGIYSTAIVTGPGLLVENLTLKLSPGGTIGGTVIDAAGDPLDQANVSLYQLEDDGLGSIRRFRGDRPDDTGAYEFAHLPPGTYFVAVTGRAWYSNPGLLQAVEGARPVADPPANLDLVYPRTFYADVTDSSSATPIKIAGGERVRVDIHPQAVPAVHLSYTLPAPAPTADGRFDHMERPPMLTQSVFGETDVALNAMSMYGNATVAGQQSLTISVPPGEYEAEVGGRLVELNAGGGEMRIDPAGGTAMTELSGKLAEVVGAPLPQPLFVSLEGAGAGATTANLPVDREGNFHSDQLRPGSYELALQGNMQGRPLALLQLAASGAQVSGHTLRLGSQPATMAATIAPTVAAVTGFAREPAPGDAAQGGPPAPGVMIVLVPEHTSEHTLYRRDQSDSDGSFSLRDVPAGTYTAVAIRDGWNLDWARPAAISRYLPAGVRVEVSAGGAAVQRLGVPLIVQQR